jgi:hypothetical protein
MDRGDQRAAHRGYYDLVGHLALRLACAALALPITVALTAYLLVK